LYTITDELLQQLYVTSEFIVFPSVYEGFGLPPLEAQLLSVPVLSSDHDCMVEILSDTGASYCDTTDANVFAQKMKELMVNKDLQKRLIESGNKNVKRYSWQKMAEETYKIYTKNN
jgi:glycosyltransferase involved in cell wall biosynthesis